MTSAVSALPYWQRNPKFPLVSAWLTEEEGDRFDFPCHSAASADFLPLLAGHKFPDDGVGLDHKTLF
jgi:hypothetical protein